MDKLDDKIEEMVPMLGSNKGFLPPTQEQLGSLYPVLGGMVPFIVRKPDGDWSQIPYVKEQQDIYFETYNCTSFNTLNSLERMEYFITGKIVNYSDRWLGYKAGTKAPGNDPVTVLKAIAKYGLVKEESLPWTSDIKNIDEYYSLKGATKSPAELDAEAEEWKNTHNFFFEAVFNEGDSMEEKLNKMTNALTSSPISLAVYAWIKKNGLYVDEGKAPTHWTAKVAEVLNQYHLIKDSYNDEQGSDEKTLAWMFKFYWPMRLHMDIISSETAEKKIGILQSIINLYRKLIAIITNAKELESKDMQTPIPPPLPDNITPTPVPPMPEVKPDMLGKFCEAIKAQEGWFPGSRSQRNNNPGNLKYVGQKLAIGKDDRNFAIFRTYEDGFLTLKNMVTRVAKNESVSYPKNCDLLRFFRIYAPVADMNDPDAYAKAVAKKCGVEIDYKLINLIN